MKCQLCYHDTDNVSKGNCKFNENPKHLNVAGLSYQFLFYLIVPRLFEEKRRDIVFGFPSFRPSVFPSFRPPNIVGTLCAQLLLQFYADSFETLQMFLSWSEDMHVVWILSSDYFWSLFSQFELSHF